MFAGKLDRRLQFRRAVLTDDGLSKTENWEDHGLPVWASRADASDGERWKAGEVGATIMTRFRVRYSSFTSDLTPKDRLVCEGREYDITGIKEVESRRVAFEITASARADK